jgi:hypothetical protein
VALAMMNRPAPVEARNSMVHMILVNLVSALTDRFSPCNVVMSEYLRLIFFTSSNLVGSGITYFAEDSFEFNKILITEILECIPFKSVTLGITRFKTSSFMLLSSSCGS